MQLAAFLLHNKRSRFFLVGADYIYPRESNRIMRDIVEQHGGEVLDELYLPIDAGEAELTDVIREIKRQEPDVVFSTLVGVVCGLPLALGASRVISTMLFGLSPTDTITFIEVMVTLVVVAVVAVTVPDLRAARAGTAALTQE